MRRFTVLWFAAALLMAAVPTARAQKPALEVTLPRQDSLLRAGPMVRAENVLTDGDMREQLDNGFPARLHYRVELWTKGGLFNSLRRSVEWDLNVRYDPLARRYEVVRSEGDRPLSDAQFPTFEATVAEVQRPYRAPIVALDSRSGQYYNVSLQVQTLDSNDLDEVEQWLRGELQPAVRGERNPGTALGRGVRQLVVRLLGAERRNLETRSPTFRVPAPKR